MIALQASETRRRKGDRSELHGVLQPEHVGHRSGSYLPETTSRQTLKRNPPEIRLSPLEEHRFDIRTARASGVTLEFLPQAMRFCRLHDVRLLIADCRSDERAALLAMEDRGFRLMNTVVSWVIDLTRPLPPLTGTAIRSVLPGEEEAVAAVAARAFQGHISHYHANPRLERARCDEIYPDWVYRWCRERPSTAEVLVAEADTGIVGFVMSTLLGPEEEDLPLLGVVPEARRSGAAHDLVVESLKWGISKGAVRCYGMTHLTNVPIQIVINRIGFLPSCSYHTLHLWLS